MQQSRRVVTCRRSGKITKVPIYQLPDVMHTLLSIDPQARRLAVVCSDDNVDLSKVPVLETGLCLWAEDEIQWGDAEYVHGSGGHHYVSAFLHWLDLESSYTRSLTTASNAKALLSCTFRPNHSVSSLRLEGSNTF